MKTQNSKNETVRPLIKDAAEIFQLAVTVYGYTSQNAQLALTQLKSEYDSLVAVEEAANQYLLCSRLYAKANAKTCDAYDALSNALANLAAIRKGGAK